MKSIILTTATAVVACALLTGCVSDALRTKQTVQKQAFTQKQRADRQVERAQQYVAISTAAFVAAKANLADKKKVQLDADLALQSVLCPPVQPATR